MKMPNHKKLKCDPGNWYFMNDIEGQVVLINGIAEEYGLPEVVSRTSPSELTVNLDLPEEQTPGSHPRPPFDGKPSEVLGPLIQKLSDLCNESMEI